MSSRFIDALAQNMADVLTVALIVAVIAGAVLLWRARQRHVNKLRTRLRGEVPVTDKVREALAKVFNLDTAEVATIGTVTFIDIAWHYSMADPHIWDHFQGPAADHIADAIQNLDVLKSSLGDHSIPLLGNIVEYFKSLEATQVFHDLLDRLPMLNGVGDSSAIVLDAHSDSLVDSLSDHAATAGAAIDAKATAASKAAGLLLHVPVITLGFATYRAWRRSQRGTGLGRNVEFAAVEVTTRAGGGLIGGQLGGALGTAIVPGVGTIVGGVAGAVAGAVGGALLGEEIKQRHVRKAQKKLNTSLEDLGKPHLAEPDNFRDLTGVFVEQERQYTRNLLATRRRLRRYSLLPWRIVWPNEKLILLREIVEMAEERLGEVKLGTIEAVERLTFMRDTEQHRQMGIILWSDPALRQRVGCGSEMVDIVAGANDKLRRELTQLGRLSVTATA
jgi:hypothetical protein